MKSFVESQPMTNNFTEATEKTNQKGLSAPSLFPSFSSVKLKSCLKIVESRNFTEANKEGLSAPFLCFLRSLL